MITSPDKFAKHISVAASRALRKKFACAGGQLIVTTPIQAVKLATTKVTGLPSPFDKNELELWNSIKVFTPYKISIIYMSIKCGKINGS